MRDNYEKIAGVYGCATIIFLAISLSLILQNFVAGIISLCFTTIFAFLFGLTLRAATNAHKLTKKERDLE